jgi:release factor glutamine methyltransferase
VTNPPYIGLDEDLPPDVGFEPREALFAGQTGLEFYERLAEAALEHLLDTGRLMMEVGYSQSRKVGDLFESAGWHVAEIRKDLSGIERVVVVQPLFA